jgi:putative ABC transport system permease protein
VYPAFPFTYFFLSEEFDQMYESEQKMGKLFIYFTIIAIVIACLGLFGLASYSAEQRRKEIGIRKVLGATEMSLVFRLAKEFTRWVILANVLAWPLAYLLIDNWLGNFAFSIQVLYHTEIFVLAAIVSLVIAILTVGYQALNASRTNPVDAIKYE